MVSFSHSLLYINYQLSQIYDGAQIIFHPLLFRGNEWMDWATYFIYLFILIHVVTYATLDFVH
jgi:hypothetical protein